MYLVSIRLFCLNVCKSVKKPSLVSFLSSPNKLQPTYMHSLLKLNRINHSHLVFISEYSQFEVHCSTHHHFPLCPPGFTFSEYTFHSDSTHSYTYIHTDALSPLWPRGLHRTIYVRFLQLDFLFSYTLWLSDNLWWPC